MSSCTPESGASETTDSQSDDDICAYAGCDDERGHDRYPKYCSVDCRYFDRALGILRTIYYDHRFCSNCYRKIRNVYPPGRRLNSSEVFAEDADDESASMTSIPDWAIGYADPTPETQRGEREHLEPANPTEGEWSYEPTDGVDVQYICKCGAGHHQTVDRPTKKQNLMEHATRLSDTVSELLNEGEHTYHHDRDTLLDHVRERKSDPDDSTPDQYVLTEALGYAILDS